MVDQPPASVARFDHVTHYAYRAAAYIKGGLLFSDILSGVPQLCVGVVPAGGVSLIVPPQEANRVNRIVAKASVQFGIDNLITGNYNTITGKILDYGNTLSGITPVNVDGLTLPRGWYLEQDYFDMDMKISRLNMPSVGVTYSVDASSFDSTIITPNPGAVHFISVGITIDIFSYDKKAVPVL